MAEVQGQSASELAAPADPGKSLIYEREGGFTLPVESADRQQCSEGGEYPGGHDESTLCDKNAESSSCEGNSVEQGSDPTLVQSAGASERDQCADQAADLEQSELPKPKDTTVPSEQGQAPFPLTKVKRIIKLDPDIKLVSRGAVEGIARATEFFLESLAAASFSVMTSNKRKSIRFEDICSAIKKDRRFDDCIGTSLECLRRKESASETGDRDVGELSHQEGGRPLSGSSGSKTKKIKKSLPPPPGSRCITDCFKKIIA